MNVKTYITYFNDKQLEEYNLQAADNIILFKGNDATIIGDNINNLNKYYCELCTLYYVWKNNLKSDYVKFIQYRRPFIVDNLELPVKKSAYVFEPAICINGIYNHFYYCHRENIKRYNILLHQMIQEYGQNHKYIYYLINSKILITNNTFLMNWNDYCNMCEFIFYWLFKLADFLNLKSVEDYENEAYKYDSKIPEIENNRMEYNSHFMSYIGERLVSCWLYNNMFLNFISFTTDRYLGEYT